MLRPSMLCAAVAATGLLAAPGAALANGTLVAGPLKAKGYDVTLTATDAGGADTFSVMAVKASGGSQQMHSWTFKGVNVSIKGGKATLKGALGSYGKVDSTVNAGRTARLSVPKGCTGSGGTARAGVLTGKTKLVLDSSFFRTIAVKSVKAQILGAGDLRCAGSGAATKGLMLTTSVDGAGGQLLVSLVKDGAGVTQQVMRNDPPAGSASVFHMISAKAGPSGLSAAGDLSNATAAAAGPFLSGALAFSGESMGAMASGTVSGDFAARFDSIGTQTIPAGSDAMLMQR